VDVGFDATLLQHRYYWFCHHVAWSGLWDRPDRDPEWNGGWWCKPEGCWWCKLFRRRVRHKRF
jgi:hypothetical protein